MNERKYTEINENNAQEVLVRLINHRSDSGPGWDFLTILTDLVGEDDFNDADILEEVGLLDKTVK